MNVCVCMHGNISILNFCFRIFFQDGLTALMVAHQKGRTEVVELLIKHNADVNTITEVG